MNLGHRVRIAQVAELERENELLRQDNKRLREENAALRNGDVEVLDLTSIQPVR